MYFGPYNLYIDDDLARVIDLCIKRFNTNHDNLIIMEGKERAGKTTLAKTIAAYYAWKRNIPVGNNNIFFDPEELMTAAAERTKDIIIWDEAAFGGQSSQVSSRLQVRLTSMLMTCGKYLHFYIFIIPSFKRLSWYLAVHRSLALVSVSEEDYHKRGPFIVLNERQKENLYEWYKIPERRYSIFKQGFHGKFSGQADKLANIFDEAEYEAKKDAAIQKFIIEQPEGEASASKKELLQLKHAISNNFPVKKLCEVLNVDDSTIYRWKRLKIPVQVDFRRSQVAYDNTMGFNDGGVTEDDGSNEDR